jgi:hypothetical protein
MDRVTSTPTARVRRDRHATYIVSVFIAGAAR